jgi:Icc-related predicted phosphoesterase
MSLLFVADLHYSLKQFDWLVEQADRFEAVVIGGDLLDLASALDFDVQIVVVEQYLERLRARTRVCVSSGNHDGDSRNQADESVARWLLEAKAQDLHVDFDHLRLGDTLLTICPWWDGPVSRGQLEELLAHDAREPKARWVWIHHAPPDNSPVSWTGKKFAGDAELVRWIGQYRPDIVLSGHIHNSPFYPEGSWIDRLGDCWVMNPGRQIGPLPSFIELDLEAMTARWISLQEDGFQQLNAPPAAAS